MSAERWLPIVGYEGKYEVSDLGRVRSLRNSGLVLRQRRNPASGYQTVDLTVGGVRKTVVIHRLVAAAFLGPYPFDGAHTRHLDGNPQNNRLSNLAYGSLGQNMDDSVRHGTHNMARKTHCPSGHPFDAINTRIESTARGRQKRHCRACERARDVARGRRSAA